MARMANQRHVVDTHMARGKPAPGEGKEENGEEEPLFDSLDAQVRSSAGQS